MMIFGWRSVALVLLLAIAAPAIAQEKPAEPPKLEEVDALRLRALAAEHRALVLEQQERARLIEAKAQEYGQAVRDAAAKAKLELKDGWRPDAERRVWVK